MAAGEDAGRQGDEAQLREAPTEPPRRRSSPSWARLIARVYQVDPLVCVRCGQKMQMSAFLTDQLSIRSLEPLGFSTQPPFHALDCLVTVKTASVLARQAIWTR